jgi:signal transduction histidine kinase
MSVRGRLPLTIPVVVAAVALALLIALLVGWNLILVENYFLTTETGEAQGRWVILTIGCVFFLVIMALLIVLIRFLVLDRERNRFQNVLLDSVTHELKSPLASIKLLIETMAMRTLPEEKVRSLTAMVIEDIERLNALIDHMLEAGRLEQARRSFDIEPVDIRETIELVVEQISRRRGIQFEPTFELSSCPETFMTDRPALELCLFNLLDNAVKYSDEPVVELTARVDKKNRLLVCVGDNGIGLDQKQRKRVFRRFYRAELSAERDARDGVGLGLFVVHSLVRGLGGRAWAESEGPGLGSRFIFQLPSGTALGRPTSKSPV